MSDHLEPNETRVARDTVIFTQGDEGHEMFLIQSGRIRLTVGSSGHQTTVATLGAGEFFGEMALLGDARRKATAVAAEDTVLLRIERDTFAMLVQDDLDVVFHMLNVQGQRLAQTNKPLETLSARLAGVALGLQALERSAQAGRFPVSVDLHELAADSDLPAATAERTVQELAQHGAGSLRDHAWVFDTPAQIQALIAALRRLARGA